MRLEVLDHEQLTDAVADNRLDLVLTNPGSFLLLRSQHSLGGALATVVRQAADQSTTQMAGVIVTQAARTDITQKPGSGLAFRLCGNTLPFALRTTFTTVVKRQVRADLLVAVTPKTSKKPRSNFAGSTICHAYLEFVGLVNDHLTTCFRHRELRGERQ